MTLIHLAQHELDLPEPLRQQLLDTLEKVIEWLDNFPDEFGSREEIQGALTELRAGKNLYVGKEKKPEEKKPVRQSVDGRDLFTNQTAFDPNRFNQMADMFPYA
jgi:hypothetical protein